MYKVFYALLLLLFFPALVYATDGIEINTASLGQLDALAGVGPVIAQRIIDARPYASLNDLLRVKGIGEKTLQKIKDQGLAYVTVLSVTEATTPSLPTPAPSKTAPKALPKTEKSAKKTIVTPSAVSLPIKQAVEQNNAQNPKLLFLIVAGIIIISSAIFFIIKFTLSKIHERS